MADFPSNAAFGGTKSTLNITAATVVSPQATRCVRVSIIVAGSTNGGVYDTNNAGNIGAANLFFVVPSSAAAGSVFTTDWPCQGGIVAVPGIGGTLAVSYSG